MKFAPPRMLWQSLLSNQIIVFTPFTLISFSKEEFLEFLAPKNGLDLDGVNIFCILTKIGSVIFHEMIKDKQFHEIVQKLAYWKYNKFCPSKETVSRNFFITFLWEIEKKKEFMSSRFRLYSDTTSSELVKGSWIKLPTTSPHHPLKPS